MDNVERMTALIAEAETCSREVCDRVERCSDCQYNRFYMHCLESLLAEYLLSHGVVLPVKCRDCKYRYGTPGQPNIQCGNMPEDGFCSYGERRDSE